MKRRTGKHKLRAGAVKYKFDAGAVKYKLGPGPGAGKHKYPKKHSRKQVVPITHTLEIRFFGAICEFLLDRVKECVCFLVRLKLAVLCEYK